MTTPPTDFTATADQLAASLRNQMPALLYAARAVLADLGGNEEAAAAALALHLHHGELTRLSLSALTASLLIREATRGER